MTQTIIPSMNLRFVEKEVFSGHSFGIDNYRKIKILQQMFTTSKGQEWCDIPLVKRKDEIE